MTKLALLAFAAALCGAAAQAQTSADAVPQTGPVDTPPITEQQLNFIDQNGDDAISRLEMESFATRLFQALDANRNGSISADEATRVITIDQFRLLDANGNGRISQAEFTRQVMADHAAADKDNDGLLR